MSHNHKISTVSVPDGDVEAIKRESNMENKKKNSADFETAMAAAGCGKFQYLLLLAIFPVSWATSIDTSSVAIILPSAECDLRMTFFQKGFLNAIVYLGMVSSGYIWGYIADVRGRRAVFLYGYLADGICNVLAGFSQNFWTLVFFKYLSGFMVSGPHASIVAYASEFFGIKGRGRIALVLGFFVTSGNIVTAVLSWIIIPQGWSIVLWDGAFVYNSWRMFLSACGLPMLIGAVCLFLFPESPKFLMSQGRMEDALEVFRTVYRMNTGKPAEEYPVLHLANNSKKGSSNVDQDGMIEKKAIFFNPHLPRLLLVTAMQFGSMYAAHTIRLWQPQLFAILDNFDRTSHNLTAGYEPTFCEILDLSSAADRTYANVAGNVTCTNVVVNESVYMTTIIVSLFGAILLLTASFAQYILRHKILLHICYIVAVTSLISMYWSTSTMVTLFLTSLFVGLTNTTLNIIVGVTVMLFPTSLRAIAVSLVMTVGRIGTITGNLLFPVVLAQGCLASMIQLACFLLQDRK
ncbi:synaptic vesicle glycoprotein 2B isoform X2 [Xylocopa sonorina]|uniref:synaptic vesicle glycoprotein 2B isoform X2 n=1 Tax=Xylocopa sonorina TaxID=1818115 RepID=UPI00403A8455